MNSNCSSVILKHSDLNAWCYTPLCYNNIIHSGYIPGSSTEHMFTYMVLYRQDEDCNSKVRLVSPSQTVWLRETKVRWYNAKHREGMCMLLREVFWGVYLLELLNKNIFDSGLPHWARVDCKCSSFFRLDYSWSHPVIWLVANPISHLDMRSK